LKRANLFRDGIGVLVAGTLLLLPREARPQPAPDWPMGGHDLLNTRHQPEETALGPENVSGLKQRWLFTAGDDVSATPAVAGDAVYVPDWAGNLFKLDAKTGAVVWTRRLTDLTGLPGTFARVTPAVAEGVVYVGTQAGAYLLAIDAVTGDLLWKEPLDGHPAALITQSPVVHQQRVYVGVASEEEITAVRLRYRCCTFRGSVVALDAATGGLLWRTYTTPDNGGAPGGYSGNAVWGGTPVVDAPRGALYVTTGNNYSVPPLAGARADNHVDSVLALDLQTGTVRWSRPVQGADAWNLACVSLFRRNCPNPPGPDFDFAQGPMLFTASTVAGSRQLLGAGQKSGIFWALDPDTGAVVWATMVGPGGTRGGMQWGSATDGSRVYVAVANSDRQPHTLVPSGRTIRGGSWSALDAATGAILWQTAVPGGNLAVGPVSVANGVVYAGSMARRGANMFALHADTGAILWKKASGGSVGGGAAVAGGTVYWGSGYSKLGQGRRNDKLYAFGLVP
jgi:polyvinyl alcohol dehydrogenase (cytochrome)